MTGSDVVAMARTGSGKSAAFLIPMLEKLKSHSPKIGARALVLAPTRELALQTLKFVKQIGKYSDLRVCMLVGGDSMQDQFTDLVLNPDIIVATPGRLMHHLYEVGLSLKAVEYVVFDEADRLFEMGFAEQLHEILQKLPENRQTLLFSATLPKLLVDFARAGLNNPKIVRLDTETKVSENLKMSFFTSRIEEKSAALLHLLRNVIDCTKEQSVIFVATRHHAEFVYELLKYTTDIPTSVIYGSMDQTARKISIAKFRNATTKLLIVTDVAARGIDIPLLDNVINYDFPPSPKLFVHRVGRAARMGRIGTAYSFVSPDELGYMVDIYLYLGKELRSTLAEGDNGDSSLYAYYGRFPQSKIDEFDDEIKEQLKLHIDLQNQRKSMTNAYKLYQKTRPKPSQESVSRSKELATFDIHPMFLKGDDVMEQKKEEFMKSLKNFKSGQTIFEVDVSNKTAAADIMATKRKIHAIRQSKQKQDELDTQKEELKAMEIEAPKKRTIDSLEIIEKPNKKQKRDEQFYLNPWPENHAYEKALSINETRTNDLAMDIYGDDGSALQQKKTVIQWDKKKKKFVKVSGIDAKKRKLSNESGKSLSMKDKAKLGKIYEEWKNKTKLELPKQGDFENPSVMRHYGGRDKRFSYAHKASKQTREDKVQSELKSKEQIKKARKLKEKKMQKMKSGRSNNMRNMKKRKQ